MAKYTVKPGTSRLNAEGVVQKAENVHDSLLGNAAYPTLQALLPALLADVQAAEQANLAMEFYGGKVAANTKREAKVRLRAQLKDLAGYVQGISGGDKALILSAAFDVVKQALPLPPAGAPFELRVTRTALAGQLKVAWPRVRGGLMYYLEMMVNGEWVRVATTTRTRHEMMDLVTGQAYSFRVQTVSSWGISGFSEVATQKAA